MVGHEDSSDERGGNEPLVRIHSEFGKLERKKEGLVEKANIDLLPEFGRLSYHRTVRNTFRVLVRFPDEIQRIVELYK